MRPTNLKKLSTPVLATGLLAILGALTFALAQATYNAPDASPFNNPVAPVCVVNGVGYNGFLNDGSDPQYKCGDLRAAAYQDSDDPTNTYFFNPSYISSITGLNMNNQPIQNVLDPTDPADVATKAYVDSRLRYLTTMCPDTPPEEIEMYGNYNDGYAPLSDIEALMSGEIIQFVGGLSIIKSTAYQGFPVPDSGQSTGFCSEATTKCIGMLFYNTLQPTRYATAYLDNKPASPVISNRSVATNAGMGLGMQEQGTPGFPTPFPIDFIRASYSSAGTKNFSNITPDPVLSRHTIHSATWQIADSSGGPPTNTACFNFLVW